MILLPAASAEATVLARGIMAQRVVRLRLNVGGKPSVYSLSLTRGLPAGFSRERLETQSLGQLIGVSSR